MKDVLEAAEDRSAAATESFERMRVKLEAAGFDPRTVFVIMQEQRDAAEVVRELREARKRETLKRLQTATPAPEDQGFAGGLFARNLFGGMLGG